MKIFQGDQLFPEIFGDPLSSLRKIPLFVKGLENSETRCAGQGIAPEGRSVGSGRKKFCKRSGGQEGPERKSAAKGLGREENIGNDIVGFIGKKGSGPADSCLDLVEDKKDVPFPREPPEITKEGGIGGNDPPPPPGPAPRRWRPSPGSPS